MPSMGHVVSVSRAGIDDPVFSLAWAEEEEDGWEVGRGREEAAKVAGQA